jgi:hypothetical protein
MDIELEEVEQIIVGEIQFINYVLEEFRRRNKIVEEQLGMSYAKHTGKITVYEDAIHAVRKVKNEVDQFLVIIRDKIRRNSATL